MVLFLIFGITLTASAFTVSSKAQIEDFLVYKAQREGLSVSKVLSIARCESGLNPLAKNPKSTASGIYQFLYSSWLYYATPYGYKPEDVFDPIKNIRVAIDVMSKYGFSAWECS